jgi:hypothetical protein
MGLIALFKSWNNSTNTSPSLSLYPAQKQFPFLRGTEPIKTNGITGSTRTHSFIASSMGQGWHLAWRNEWMNGWMNS